MGERKSRYWGVRVSPSGVLSSFIGTMLGLSAWIVTESTTLALGSDNVLKTETCFSTTKASLRENNDVINDEKSKPTQFPRVRQEVEKVLIEPKRVLDPSLRQSPKVGSLAAPERTQWVPADPEQYPLARPLRDDTEARNFGDPSLMADIE